MRAETLRKTTHADSPIVRAVPVGAWRSPVSAPVWGTGGRGFKSRRPDQKIPDNHILLETAENQLFPESAAGNSMGIEKASIKALGIKRWV